MILEDVTRHYSLSQLLDSEGHATKLAYKTPVLWWDPYQ